LNEIVAWKNRSCLTVGIASASRELQNGAAVDVREFELEVVYRLDRKIRWDP
jgi:hypothetical protein